MNFKTLLGLALLGATTATPLNSIPRDFFYKPLTLTFQGGPASNELALAADGNSYATNNGMNINLINSPDFDAYHFCNFYTTGYQKVGINPSGSQLAVGPPAPIISVDCEPTPGGSNTCLPAYASCEWCGGGDGGCMVPNCCSGLCFGTKCRVAAA